LILRGFGYVLLGLIVYASIYPFEFGRGAVARLPLLFDLHNQIASDIVENILAFVPMGVAFRLTASRRQQRVDFVIAAGVAVLLQILQLWIPGRQPALTDAVWNGVGLGLGAWATTALRWVGDGPRALSPVGLALILLFGLHLAVVGFIHSGSAGSAEQQRLLFDWANSRGLLPALPWAAGALTFAPLLKPRLKTLARLAAAGLIFILLWQGLTPVTWVKVPFQWVPLRSFMMGLSWNLVATITWKLFLFGALTRVLMLSGVRSGQALAGVCVLVLGVEIAQSLLGSGSPDITDPLLALLCAWGVVQEASVHAQRVGGGRRDGLRHFR
jgi:VanZ family protein